VKPASPALIALLASRQFNYAGLYHFSLVGGGNLYYTGGDTGVLFGGNLYGAGGSTGPYFDTTDNAATAHWKTGVEVDTLTFDVIPAAATVNGIPLLTALRQGVFDGAELTFSHAYWPKQAYATPVVPTDAVVMFAGRVAEVDWGRSLATFTVNSHLELLNQNMPRNLYQSGCVNTLYDSSCSLSRASLGVGGTALAGSTASQISANLANATGYFDLGSITFSGGANSGVSRSVKAYAHGSPGTVTLLSPLPNTPANGDAFTIYPGCDKASATCSAKFGNLANFRGAPFIPSNETSV
jgi:uncharacterized phage protein (TIGR02218 family)